MAAQYPGAVPNFSSMVGTSTDPLSAPSHVTLEQKQADEIVALAQFGSPLRVKYVTGEWYAPDQLTAFQTSAPATGTLIVSRYDFPPGTSIVQLGEWVATVGGAGALRRLLIYNDTGNGYPGSLQRDCGTYAGDAGTGFQTVTAFTSTDVSGTRWIGAFSTVATTTIVAGNNSVRSMHLTTVVNGNLSWAGYQQTGVSVAPDPFSTTQSTVNGAPRIFFKIA